MKHERTLSHASNDHYWFVGSDDEERGDSPFGLDGVFALTESGVPIAMELTDSLVAYYNFQNDDVQMSDVKTFESEASYLLEEAARILDNIQKTCDRIEARGDRHDIKINKLRQMIAEKAVRVDKWFSENS